MLFISPVGINGGGGGGGGGEWERDSETTDITYIVLFYVVLFNLLALSRERGTVHHIVPS